MKLYIVGHRDENEPALVTVETIDSISDLSKLEIDKIPNIVSPFYRSVDLNCGKIIKITDMTEKIEYFWANINGIKLQKGQYFLAGDTDKITCYMYKTSAAEDAEPCPTFSGVRYKHYNNGLLKTKKCYMNGVLVCSYSFRNDIYNTVSDTAMFKNGRPELVNIFNDQEVLQEQKVLTGKGKVFMTYQSN